jgi:hypothetical protein
MKKNAIVAVEYMYHPIHCNDLDSMGPVYYEDENMSTVLIEKFNSWNQKYQDTLDHSYPPDSREFNEEELEAFNKEGLELAYKLTKEIGDKYKIKYRSLDYNNSSKEIEIN